jgi:hypothetical protein
MNSMTETKIYSKLKGLPHLRYLNLDAREDRRDYIEEHFKNYGVTDYVRISADRYGPHNYEDWKDSLRIAGENKYIRKDNICYVSILVNQLQSIIDWYNENTSETCIILEDDFNMDTVKFWTFTWEYFVSHLPCNWDCVQLQVIGGNWIPMGLTQRTKNNHGATAYLINRRYAEKLINMHYIDGKFTFYNNYGYSKNWPEYHYQSPDFVPFEIGVTYTFPLFITNSAFGSDCYDGLVNLMARKSDYLIAKWWKEDAYRYSMQDLFNVNTLKRKELILPITYNEFETRKVHGHSHSGE